MVLVFQDLVQLGTTAGRTRDAKHLRALCERRAMCTSKVLLADDILEDTLVDGVETFLEWEELGCLHQHTAEPGGGAGDAAVLR